jgi:hypothetical protein
MWSKTAINIKDIEERAIYDEPCGDHQQSLTKSIHKIEPKSRKIGVLIENGLGRLFNSNKALFSHHLSCAKSSDERVATATTSNNSKSPSHDNKFSKLLNLIKFHFYKNSLKKKLNKHVMFADTLGLDLELIHTIHINTGNTNNTVDELSKLISRQSFFNAYSNSLVIQQQQQQQGVNVKCTAAVSSDKLIIPRFTLSPDRNYEKLIANGICLNSIEIYNESSIRGHVLTLTNSNETTSAAAATADEVCLSGGTAAEYTVMDREELINECAKNNLKSILKLKSHLNNLDIVYIIWSCDDWTSWKYQAAIKNNCRHLPPNKGILKTYEFFLQNLDTKLLIGQSLQLIICHQIDLIVYKDTNNEMCYKFECALKI